MDIEARIAEIEDSRARNWHASDNEQILTDFDNIIYWLKACREETTTKWKYDDYYGDYWECDCGEAFTLDGNLADNHYRYCPACGGSKLWR